MEVLSTDKSLAHMQNVVDKYAMENLVGEDNVMNIMEKLVDVTNLTDQCEDFATSVGGGSVDADSIDAVHCLRQAQREELQVTASVRPTVRQARVINQLKHGKAGLHVVTGGPGTGKTFITQHLVHHYRTTGRKMVSR